MTRIAGLTAEEISRAAREMDFSGVVSIAPLDDGDALELAFGYADWGHKVLNRTDTRFAMGSGCKLFTAAAIGLLIDEGRIGLDTRLAHCVRSRQFHFGDAVTIGQLLDHSAGIPDYFSEELESDYAALFRERPSYSMNSVRDFLPLFENGAMKAPPGQEFIYCNAGFVLLGFVVEELMGRDFREVIAERIFRPCGMERSGYFAMDAPPEDTALGYVSRGAAGWRTNIFSVASVGGADGGAFTTVGDLRRFWTAFLAGKILRRATLERFLAPSAKVTERDGDW
ncbi:MAG TPA: serine hydrolase domain-containing protein, partial [Dongiaceae bacterium]